jgi:hypothetical protein
VLPRGVKEGVGAVHPAARSGPSVAVAGHGVAPKQERQGRETGGVPATVWGSGGLKFDSNSNSNKFKLFQVLTDPKGTSPSSKKLKENMVVNDLKKEITFSIGTSSDSKWILN